MAKDLPNDEIRYRLLKLLDENPSLSQRELAQEMGVSLGKLNYCLRALVQVGYIKAGNFAKSDNKLKYAYVLTPKGIGEKAAVTQRFLDRKITEYKFLKAQIAALEKEARALNSKVDK